MLTFATESRCSSLRASRRIIFFFSAFPLGMERASGARRCGNLRSSAARVSYLPLTDVRATYMHVGPPRNLFSHYSERMRHNHGVIPISECLVCVVPARRFGQIDYEALPHISST